MCSFGRNYINGSDCLKLCEEHRKPERYLLNPERFIVIKNEKDIVDIMDFYTD